MAFATLFSGLSPMAEDVRNPGGSHTTPSNRSEDGSRGKRKTQGEQHGSYKKKCQQFQTEDSATCWSKPCQKQAAKSERSSPGQMYKSHFNWSQNSRQGGYGPYNQTKDNGNMNKMHQWNQKKKKKQPNNRRAKPKLTLQEKPKFMSQEFKDQNAVLFDGRLLCRHFLFERCIKEDQCQLEHATCNDIIKEACKFYIQGACLKGEKCPYMHKSFPCKFFHSTRCFQEGNCKFSHDPLTDITKKLLDEVWKKEECLKELAKNNEKESSEQMPKTEETKPAEENKNPDFLTQPHRPCFYNSADAEKEPPEHPIVTEPCVLDRNQPDGSTSTSQSQQEPVPYSVEAVLGPQLSRTLSSFSKTLTSLDDSSTSEPHATSSGTCPNQSIAPYSVEAVLRSYSSADDSPKGQTPDPAAKRIPFYAPLVISEEIKAPPFRKEKLPSSLSEDGSQCTMPKSLSSVEVKCGLVSDQIPVLFNTPEDEQKTYTKQELYNPERSASCRSKGLKNSLYQPKLNSSTGRDAIPVHPVATCDKKRDSAGVVFHNSQLPENSRNNRLNVQTGTQEQFSNTSLKSISRAPILGDVSAAGNKMQKIPFKSLFASPLTDSAAPGSESAAAAAPLQQAEDRRHPSLPFISLFASPLSENPSCFPRSEKKTPDPADPPCKQQLAENAALSSKQRASDSIFPSPVSSLREASAESSQRSKTVNHLKEPPSSVCSTLSDSPRNPSSNRTDQNQSDDSSPRATSVLKSLFVELTPFQEDGE
ncbi:PREDICTED: uncharacterized protein LOC107085466 isoform X1 [Cyprinodon variegatus]|uniref:Uncharacterized LOC107085466 n=1 Tax=Cyprinodon variegatus TaxID=28743 RepID=A0A3Q2CL85_CYPVA|nr:PREDICTED: uncharacterized protein LOC107085466 isoform X1 [Cyprinodon variegatus]